MTFWTQARRLGAALLLLGLSLAARPARAADPIRIYAAGSLGTVMGELIAA